MISLTKYTYAAALSLGLCFSAVSASKVSAGETPQWPSEQEQMIKQADSRILEVQRARFRAKFGDDKEAAERLDRQFKDLQKERNQLLRESGRH